MLRALPNGAASHIATAFRERRVDGLARSARIVAGLAVAVVGYLVGVARPGVAGDASFPVLDTA